MLTEDSRTGGLDQYLKALLRFLVQNLERYQFVAYLTLEILEHIKYQSGDPDLVLYAECAQNALSLQRIAGERSDVKKIWFEELEYSRANSKFDQRSNAILGIALGKLIDNEQVDNSLGAAVRTWAPLSPENPSSFERLAMAYLPTNKSIPSSIHIIGSLELKTMVGFAFSRRHMYSLAKAALIKVLPEIESSFGASSWEYGIIIAEFVKCCVLIGEEDVGEQWARQVLSQRSGIDNRADTLYIRVALADSLLASSNYEAAVEVLESLLDAVDVDASLSVKVILRLSKAQRRLGKICPGTQIMKVLVQGLQILHDVSGRLQCAFLEEMLCVLSHADIVEEPFRHHAQNICGFIKTVSAFHHGSAARNGEFSERLKSELQQLIDLISMQKQTSK